MKLQLIFGLLLLAVLAGCSSATEKQALYEVAEFYGGSVRFTKGDNASATNGEPQGHYLAIALRSPGLARRYDDLHLPASNCAYLAFNNLTPAERETYDYVKVTLQDSGSTHTYTFKRPELEQVLLATTNLRTLIFNIQSGEYSAVASNFNAAALGTVRRDSLLDSMRRLGHRINPFTEYRIHGFNFVDIPGKGQPQELVRLFIAVPRPPAPDHVLLAVINPKLSETQPFLYGLNLAQ